jgi:hypothetical protein
MESSYINLFKRDNLGWYVCGCGFYDINKDRLDDHASRKIAGFCENGVSFDGTSYKCICGKKFTDMRESEKHYKDNGRCIITYISRNEKTCKICNLTCRTDTELIVHQKSEKHLKKLSGEYLKKYCNVCKVMCHTQNQIKAHLETKKHKKQVELGEIAKSKIPLDCKICNVKFTSQNQIKSHLETKKHKDMVASGKIADEKLSLTCDICKITCLSQKTIRAHLETKKHKKLLSINDISQSIGTKQTNE